MTARSTRPKLLVYMFNRTRVLADEVAGEGSAVPLRAKT